MSTLFVVVYFRYCIKFKLGILIPNLALLWTSSAYLFFAELLYSIVYSARWVSIGLNLWYSMMYVYEISKLAKLSNFFADFAELTAYFLSHALHCIDHKHFNIIGYLLFRNYNFLYLNLFRFQKCLRKGMLKEGVRLDRVRGGRQKYR